MGMSHWWRACSLHAWNSITVMFVIRCLNKNINKNENKIYKDALREFLDSKKVPLFCEEIVFIRQCVMWIPVPSTSFQWTKNFSKIKFTHLKYIYKKGNHSCQARGTSWYARDQTRVHPVLIEARQKTYCCAIDPASIFFSLLCEFWLKEFPRNNICLKDSILYSSSYISYL